MWVSCAAGSRRSDALESTPPATAAAAAAAAAAACSRLVPHLPPSHLPPALPAAGLFVVAIFLPVS